MIRNVKKKKNLNLRQDLSFIQTLTAGHQVSPLIKSIIILEKSFQLNIQYVKRNFVHYLIYVFPIYQLDGIRNDLQLETGPCIVHSFESLIIILPICVFLPVTVWLQMQKTLDFLNFFPYAQYRCLQPAGKESYLGSIDTFCAREPRTQLCRKYMYTWPSLWYEFLDRQQTSNNVHCTCITNIV